MKTFKEKLMAVLAVLGFVEKQKTSSLSKEDMDKVVASYNETHKSDFFADMKADQEQAQKAANLDAAMAMLAAMTSETQTEAETTENTEASEKETKTVDLAQAIRDLATKNANLEKVNKENSDKIEKLSNTLEKDNPKNAEIMIAGFGKAHTDKFAFGIEHPMFSADKRFNKITINPKLAILGAPSDNDEKVFQTEVTGFGRSLAERYAYLHANNMLRSTTLGAATSIDVTDPGNDFGNYFLKRRQDAIIAQILKIKTVYDVFPRRYGIQDMETIFNAIFTDVSQAWQKGRVFKGSAIIQPETGHVDDTSIKLQFEPLTVLERNYLGYLNTEGSDPVKWGMIEWYTIQILEKAIQEQTTRRVNGCYVKPETDKAGPFINGSTGLIFTLIRYYHQNKMLLVPDAAFGSYDSTNMYDTVKAYIDKVVVLLGTQDLRDYCICLNERHRTWWLTNIRAKFGKDYDFTGPQANMIPDYEVMINWLPTLEKKTFIILCKTGNLQCLENLPGEMMALNFWQDFEDVLVRSKWKEGFSAAFVGKKFSTYAALLANNYEYQQIYMNKPMLALVSDSITLDATLNFWFGSIANATAGKKILDIAGAKKGQVYVIECGSTVNPQSIDLAAKFANLVSAWTPTTVGDYIMVILNDAGDAFRELERCIGGVRTVNALVQPTLPEARA